MSIFDEIKIEEIPEDLLNRERGPVYTGDVTKVRLRNCIRHRYSNYDELRRRYRLDHLQTKVLCSVVNERIDAILAEHPLLSAVKPMTPERAEHKRYLHRRAMRSGGQ